MRPKLKLLGRAIIFACVFMTLTSFKFDNDCSIMYKGTFIYYGQADGKVKVVIDGDVHIEYHDKGKYLIKSKITWVSNCEFNMTMTKITIPNFPYKVGDVMNVKINQVKGDKIFYTSTVNDNSWDSELIKIGK